MYCDSAKPCLVYRTIPRQCTLCLLDSESGQFGGEKQAAHLDLLHRGAKNFLSKKLGKRGSCWLQWDAMRTHHATRQFPKFLRRRTVFVYSAPQAVKMVSTEHIFYILLPPFTLQGESQMPFQYISLMRIWNYYIHEHAKRIRIEKFHGSSSFQSFPTSCSSNSVTFPSWGNGFRVEEILKSSPVTSNQRIWQDKDRTFVLIFSWRSYFLLINSRHTIVQRKAEPEVRK